VAGLATDLLKGLSPLARMGLWAIGLREQAMSRTRWPASTFLIFYLGGAAAFAADISVLSQPGIRAAVDELIPEFERRTANKVSVRYEIYAGQKANIEAGNFDVAIFPKAQIEEMSKKSQVRPGSGLDLARTNIGVVVRRGADKPDISTEQAFRETLLNAKSIAYTKESSTGVYVTRLLDRLGLTEALRHKVQTHSGGGMTTPAVARGEAEIGIVLVSDILATPGVDLVGPLPKELQNSTTLTAAVSQTSKEPAAAEALITWLANVAAAPTYASKGLEPAR
jgi:molybdate transport system substrate-binding protein